MELHPLMSSSFVNWMRLVSQNGGVDRAYVGKAIATSLFSLSGSLGRTIERSLYDSQIRQVKLEQPPIFVIGHWRSGTTFLHNLISQDPSFAHVSCHQAWAPELFMSSGYLTKPIMAGLMPTQRPMDNIRLSPDSPQEEEFALSCMSLHSFYHSFFFPRQMQQYFKQYVLFEDITPAVRAEWQRVYLSYLKKISFAAGHKQLLLKNPTNTGRIKILLELFPEAKFIHIYRNPYSVYVSMQNFYRRMLPLFSFQTLTQTEIQQNILVIYQQLMQQFFEQCRFIPASNLVAVKYEDFESNPIGELVRTYDCLQLPNFDHAKPRFEAYLAGQARYRKNYYSIDAQTIETISEAWQFTIDRWHYHVPDSL